LLLQPGHTVSVPGKLYEYLAAARPILSIAEDESETADLVRSSGIGVSVTLESEAALIEALMAVMAVARQPFQPPMRETYDGNLGAVRIAEIIRGATEPRELPREAIESYEEGAKR
jgi:hypothetical protein